MEILQFVPGAVLAGAAITIPNTAPNIDAVVTAQIIRVPTALADHPAADVVGALADHAAADIVAALADHAAADILGAIADHTAVQMQAALANHTQAEIVAAIADHAVHTHTLQVQAGAAVEAFGATGAGVADLRSASGQTIPGGVAATGIQNNAAAQAHAAGGAPAVHAGAADVAHAVGAAPIAHAVGAAAMVHGAGAAPITHVSASPIVAAVPTISTARIITLDVNTLLGDVLVLSYLAVGERILVS